MLAQSDTNGTVTVNCRILPPAKRNESNQQQLFYYFLSFFSCFDLVSLCLISSKSSTITRLRKERNVEF